MKFFSKHFAGEDINHKYLLDDEEDNKLCCRLGLL
jgi:hypothetical protein